MILLIPCVMVLILSLMIVRRRMSCLRARRILRLVIFLCRSGRVRFGLLEVFGPMYRFRIRPCLLNLWDLISRAILIRIKCSTSRFGNLFLDLIQYLKMGSRIRHVTQNLDPLFPWRPLLLSCARINILNLLLLKRTLRRFLWTLSRFLWVLMLFLRVVCPLVDGLCRRLIPRLILLTLLRVIVISLVILGVGMLA